jgi:hypothetical protein
VPKPVLYAAIIGFLIGSMTNVGFALLCGGMLGLITWSILGFRIDQESTATQNISPESPAERENPKSQPAHHYEVGLGKGIADSLSDSCSSSLLTAQEFELAHGAGASKLKYYQEVILLCASAQLIAIRQSDQRIRSSIELGFKEIWPDIRLWQSTNTIPLSQLEVRVERYTKAIQEHLAADKSDSETVRPNPIILQFQDFLTPPDAPPQMQGMAFLLSTISAEAYFDSHFQGTAENIARAIRLRTRN